ncbi:RDD family protein [Amycolatopsis alkalitolerans]|uniref:RDD family protein n=1 Tax=Amycolatopsis alkalitolerans TaxID=2547244 RepID=A0A5C4LYB6_9PSEU|nr:RDD family protein [Amycolatopsis alkalitolerans]TNC23162.1 RDD family protein [Amycolatopsis alkalitolerans]
MSPEPDLVTGDAVVLDLRLARVASRGLALAIDALIQLVVLLAGLIVVTVAGPGDDALRAAILLSLLVLVRVGYPLLFETLSRGKTPGKAAFGLRVVRDDGGPIRFRHALTRALAGAIVDFGPVFVWGAVALICSLVSEKSKRVGDFLAGTVVVMERAPQEVAVDIVMPAPLISWAAQLDLSGLPDDLALAVRQYLARYLSLRPEAADSLGWHLAQEVAERIGTPVPPGVPPWAYLMAVLAERRNRSYPPFSTN